MPPPAFVPPPLSSYEGPAPDASPAPAQSAAPFVPPPLSSYEGPASDNDGDPHSVLGFAGNLLSSGANLAGNVYNVFRHPIDTATGIATAVAGLGPDGPEGSWQHDVAKPTTAAVGDAYKQRYGGLSNIGETLYHDPVGVAADVSTVASGTGGLLRTGARVADLANAGRVATGLRTAGNVATKTGDMLNPVSAPFRAVRAGVRKLTTVPSSLNPVEQAAVDYALSKGAPVDVANASGNGFMGAAKTILQKQPLSAGIAGQFGRSQIDWMRNKASSLAASVSPAGPKTRLTAGLNIEQEVAAKLNSYRAAATAAYDNLFQTAEANPQNVQVGWKPDLSAGPLAPQMIPDMQDVAGPTNTGAVKAAAQPILDELEKTIPMAQQQMSPSISLLRQIISRPDYVDLRTAVTDNSAIQNVARNETIPQIRTQAQRIASTLVGPYRDAIDDAAQTLGAPAMQSLQDGRAATIAKYDLGKVIPRGMRGKQVQIVQLMTAGDDSSVPILRKLQAHVPGSVPGIARATIESIFDHATEEGGFSKVDGALNKWNKLGDETKQILFGPNVTDEVTNLLMFAKNAAKDANPSGSAGVALVALLMHDPMAAIGAMVGSRAMARGLFNTNVARSVRQTGRIPTPTLPRALNAVAPVTNAATRVNPYVNPYR